MLCLAYNLKIIQIATESTAAESVAKCVEKYDHLLMDVKKIFVCAKKNCLNCRIILKLINTD
jgi:hypothetical protein